MKSRSFHLWLFSLAFSLDHPKVEFEARGPEEEDFQGIRRLLQQLFVRNTVVNIGKIAEAILSQKYLGSVIKQSAGEVEDDAEDDLDDPNEVYAVSTVISLTEKQKESVAGIRFFHQTCI